MVFPTFFNLSLNLAIRSLLSEPQLAPGLVYVQGIEILCNFDCKQYNQSDVSILNVLRIPDHITCTLRKIYAGEEGTVRAGRRTMD